LFTFEWKPVRKCR